MPYLMKIDCHFGKRSRIYQILWKSQWTVVPPSVCKIITPLKTKTGIIRFITSDQQLIARKALFLWLPPKQIIMYQYQKINTM